jgi:hypothetical protein
MASIPENTRKEALSGQLAASRIEVGQQVGQRVARVRQMLDVPARTKAAIGRHPAALLGGSLAFGLLASVWLRRRRRKRSHVLVDALARTVAPARKASIMAGAFSMLGGMARTAAKAYVLEKIVKMVSPTVIADITPERENRGWVVSPSQGLDSTLQETDHVRTPSSRPR